MKKNKTKKAQISSKEIIRRRIGRLKIATYTLVILFGLAALAIAIVIGVKRSFSSYAMFYGLIGALLGCQILCLGSMALGYGLQTKWFKKYFDSTKEGK